MPRRNKSLKLITFGGNKGLSSKRGGGISDWVRIQVDNLRNSAKKASNATNSVIKGIPTQSNFIDEKSNNVDLSKKVTKLEERVSRLENNNVTVPSVPVNKIGGRKRKTRRRRQSKKSTKNSRKSRKH